MAGHPIDRKRLQTDPSLLRLASEVPLYPKKNRAVFYADDFGDRLASPFIKKNPEFTASPEKCLLIAGQRLGHCVDPASLFVARDPPTAARYSAGRRPEASQFSQIQNAIFISRNAGRGRYCTDSHAR